MRRPVDCPDCIAAGLHMKAQGFRDWRTAYACYDCAGMTWDEIYAAFPDWPRDEAPAPEQRDLFA